ncbi:UdgX family uracil-DNA binding protein [Phenylobacterium immobile]|uniref:UdgX family uracil-DNA binding protein n=1 Tax=Phenylobacterium immobile TaxID=21 RepID=UPI000A63F655|nr:UdgX family uracil-DNA binding protein [Phenylobacterium immobile]
MAVVRLESEIDIAGWRRAARVLRAQGARAEEVVWTVGPNLFEEASMDLEATASFTVPRAFVELADRVLLHRSGERFDLMYRLLRRLGGEPNLLKIETDSEVAQALLMAKAVDRAAHKMRAFVRFREIETGEGAGAFVAWFEPAHRVTELVAPWFARRFTNMDWSLLTPDVSVHWDRTALTLGPGADPADVPHSDALEAHWRTYYAAIFNPARLNVAQMTKEMPKRYWRNLPEAALIPELVARAESRTETMVMKAPTEPDRRIVRQAHRAARDGSFEEAPRESLELIAAGVDACRRCPLWKDATQGVPGEGPPRSRLMFVGEQPGDQEDLAGAPFVGPAGQVFDRAMAEAGVDRRAAYVTNAVKHFKHELRGKRRIHQTPTSSEAQACRWWLDGERRLVRPRVIVALGATAAGSVFGKAMPIGKSRGQAFELPDQAQGVVTYHPSYLLRIPDERAKVEAYSAFVADLKFAGELAG